MENQKNNNNKSNNEIFQRLTKVETKVEDLTKDFDSFMTNHFKTFESKMCTRYEILLTKIEKLDRKIIKYVSLFLGGGVVIIYILEKVFSYIVK